MFWSQLRLIVEGKAKASEIQPEIEVAQKNGDNYLPEKILKDIGEKASELFKMRKERKKKPDFSKFGTKEVGYLPSFFKLILNSLLIN